MMYIHDVELGEEAYEFYCAMATDVAAYREASMEKFRSFWETIKQMPKAEALDLFRQEMDKQLLLSGLEKYKY